MFKIGYFFLVGLLCVSLYAAPIEIVPISYHFDQSTSTGSFDYSDWGGQLTDGVYGVAPWSTDLGHGPAYEWVGWVSPVVNIDFDFGETSSIGKINVGTVQDSTADVVIPSVYIYSSTDSSSWTLVDYRSIPESSSYNNTRLTIELDNLNIASRYIRVSARFSSDGPWTFLDEVDFYGTVPEPASLWCLLVGLVSVVGYRKK